MPLRVPLWLRFKALSVFTVTFLLVSVMLTQLSGTLPLNDDTLSKCRHKLLEDAWITTHLQDTLKTGDFVHLHTLVLRLVDV